MLNQRYQIFVSSTYEDLRDERREILDTILQMGHFPTGMEHLPASGQMPWEIIKHMIDDCDYYVLVIAGRYGSMTEGDISYTEREYNYAMEIGKHILRFPHAAPEELPANRVEPQASMKRKLDAFRKEATSQGSFKTWKSATDLKLIVTQGLSYAFSGSTHYLGGWVESAGMLVSTGGCV